MLQTIILSLFLGNAASAAVWQPAPGERFQIVLSSILDIRGEQEIVPSAADIFDIDLFQTPKETINTLHAKGKKVICYFSAGGSETWRPDDYLFNETDRGDTMREWRGERWLDIRSPTVWDVIKKRIQLASENGCDAIDPDNVDAFNHDSGRGGGFAVHLTQDDAVTYVKKLAAEAHSYNMSMGLKNSEEILPSVLTDIQFAVNEECASTSNSEGCIAYTKLINAGKPVFHIEYADHKVNGNETVLWSEKDELEGLNSTQIESLLCLKTTLRNKRVLAMDTRSKFSTVIKVLGLDGWVMYCDGIEAATKTRPSAS